MITKCPFNFANELMIGDYFQSEHGTPLVFLGMYNGQIRARWADGDEEFTFTGIPSPIALTEELLLLNGWEKNPPVHFGIESECTMRKSFGEGGDKTVDIERNILFYKYNLTFATDWFMHPHCVGKVHDLQHFLREAYLDSEADNFKIDNLNR